MKLLLGIIFVIGLPSLLLGQSEPPYGMSNLEAYAVFSDAYRTGDYDLAVTFGEWMLEAKPREIQGHGGFNLEQQYVRFIAIYTKFAVDANDPAEKSVLFARVLDVFDMVEETFEETEIDRFRWTYRKARFYHENQEHLENGMKNAIEYYEKAYQMNQQQFAELSDGFYARFLLSTYVSRGESEKALHMIDQIEAYASPSLAGAIDEARNELFSNPEERVVFLEERLEREENPQATLEELISLYERLGDRQKVRETAQKLYEINPGFGNTRRLADIAISNAEYQTALRYLNEAYEKSPDANRRKRIALEIADTYQNLDNLQSAREHTLRAIEIDNNFGQAYLQIASIYASTISQCTSGRRIEREDRTVYWLILDYLDRAAERDPSVRNAANRQRQSYLGAIPSSEDKFFRGWETGDVFAINGSIGECYNWINETTTVR